MATTGRRTAARAPMVWADDGALTCATSARSGMAGSGGSAGWGTSPQDAGRAAVFRQWSSTTYAMGIFASASTMSGNVVRSSRLPRVNGCLNSTAECQAIVIVPTTAVRTVSTYPQPAVRRRRSRSGKITMLRVPTTAGSQ